MLAPARQDGHLAVARDANPLGQLRGRLQDPRVKGIADVIDDGGDITIGPVGQIECAATAADAHNALAMLVRRDGETLHALLKRLDKAIARFNETGEPTDEINLPSD